MTKTIWFWVAVVTVYVTALFQVGEYLFFFLPEARLQTAARVLIVISLGFVMWKFIPSAWGRVVSRPTGNRMLVVGFISLVVLAPVYGGNELGDLKVALLLNYFIGSMLVGVAQELTRKVRENIKVDWFVRESTQAALRVMVRDLLDKYGYPPDFSNMAIETVVRQAESLTEEWLQDSIIG
jgi:hypothetical protein